MPARRVLVVGGAGAFGSRLVERLLATTDHVVVVAGRDEERTRAAAERLSGLHPGFPVEAVRLDAATVDAEMLKAMKLWAVVDAAGPFQGAEPHLAEAAVAAGCHYVDIADARDFVRRIPALDAAARRAGVVVLTGASSTPALSNAVADRLTRNWGRVESVFAGISAGSRAPRGASVVRAVLSWAGRPVRVFLGGRWQERPGWSMAGRRRIAGLGRRWLSLAETPDLDLFVQRYRPTRAAVFAAGLELPVLHLGLLAVSLPARLKGVPAPTLLAGLLARLARYFERFGSDRGGMVVEVIGAEATGRRVRSTWTLAAEPGVGPTVPVLPAVAALKVIATGKLLPRADVAAGRVPLEAIEAELERLPITTSVVTTVLEPQFRRALGAAFERLPTPVRLLHAPAPLLAYDGHGTVEAGAGPLARLVAALAGLPRRTGDVPVRVEIEDLADSERDCELWTRDFGGRRFASRIAAGPPGSGTIEERFGPIAIRLRLEADPAGLAWTAAGWRIGRLPMPRFLAPRVAAREGVDEDGRFAFDVAVDLPLGLGRLVRYRGSLAPAAEAK